MLIVFIPGLELSRRFYVEAVEPLVSKHFGDVPHTAARIGEGSEVLGFDTERSADHEWGPRLQLFVNHKAPDISRMLSEHLPKTFLGHPTNFEGGDRIRSMSYTDGPVFHRVDVTSLGAWFDEHVGFDPRETITDDQWLTTSAQTFAEVTGGAVFHDGLNELTTARERLRWYPDHVYRQILARHWRLIAKKEAFVGRCGEVGDEVGSAVVAARQVRLLMKLCLLMHRRYPPYAKWLGSAFAQLPVDIDFISVLTAATWQDRETHLAAAYTTVAELHNELKLTEPLDPSTGPYYERPFQVLRADRFADALQAP